MSSGLAAFPATLPSGTVVGRVAIGSGPAEAVAIAALWAALNSSSYIGQIVTKRKTADQSLTSNITLTNDADLSFPIAANEEWVGYFNIAAGSAINGTGAKAALNAPSGATIQFDGLAVTNNAGVTTGGTTTIIGTAIDFSAASLTPSSAGAFMYRFWILNGSTPGNVTLQWAQSSSSGSALIFKKGSFMQTTRVA